MKPKHRVTKHNTQIGTRLLCIGLIATSLFIMSCGNDDDFDSTGEISLTDDVRTYALYSVSNPAIKGTVTFAERSDRATLITIDLDGTTPGDSYPAHIHANTAAETGDVIIDLNSIDGTTGISETVVKKKNSGALITYDQLVDLNGYLDVHLNTSTLLVQGDIGENATKDVFMIYPLSAANNSGINGTVTFSRRLNGNTLVTVQLDNASVTGDYPAYIYSDESGLPSSIALDLNRINGATRASHTNVVQLNNGTAISYAEIETYEGHIVVRRSATDSTRIAQVGIGPNQAYYRGYYW